MSNNKDFIKFLRVPRLLFKNNRWREKPFSKARAEIDLYYLANFMKNTIHKRGIPINLDPGQVGWSMLGLSDRWGWSEAKVKRYVKSLENEGQIDVQISKVSTKITLLNYIKNDGQNERKTTDKRRYKRKTEYKLIKDDIIEGGVGSTNTTPLDLTKYSDQYPALDLPLSYKKYSFYCSGNSKPISDEGFDLWCQTDINRGWNLRPGPEPGVDDGFGDQILRSCDCKTDIWVPKKLADGNCKKCGSRFREP